MHMEFQDNIEMKWSSKKWERLKHLVIPLEIASWLSAVPKSNVILKNIFKSPVVYVQANHVH